MSFSVKYVTGLHRAGTHSYANYLAERDSLINIEEGKIQWDDLEAAILLKQGMLQDPTKPILHPLNLRGKNGIVCQCPGLAHETEELSNHGKVYWVTRSHEHIITSMKNAAMNEMAWHLMKGFKNKWPDDPIWGLLQYDGGSDVHNNYTGYYTLLIRVKEYFYEKNLKNFAERIVTEDQPYYDFDSTATARAPLRARELEQIRKHEDHWTEVWQRLTSS